MTQTRTKTSRTQASAADDRQAVILRIAREEFDLETLEPRNHDRLDFHDVAVWQIRTALLRAYEAGRASR